MTALPMETPPEKGVDMLTHMMGLQLEFQVFLYGQHPASLDTLARISYLRDMLLALQCEGVELLDEVGWKPWASSRHVNVELARSELIDIAHFLFSLAAGLGMSPKMFYTKFLEKQTENRRRALEGYTGIDEKCVLCSRDVGDVTRATGLKPVELPHQDVDGEEPRNWMCGQCHAANAAAGKSMPRIDVINIEGGD